MRLVLFLESLLMKGGGVEMGGLGIEVPAGSRCIVVDESITD